MTFFHTCVEFTTERAKKPLHKIVQKAVRADMRKTTHIFGQH